MITRIAVIGGSIAGLTFAKRLKELDPQDGRVLLRPGENGSGAS